MPSPRIFYGWYIVAGVFLVTMTTSGLAFYNLPILLAAFVAERFGTRVYGRIYSTSQLMTMIGVAGCPSLVGLLYEASGGYVVPFLAVAGLTLIGLAVLALFGARR